MPAPWGPVGEGAGEGPGKAASSQSASCKEGTDGHGETRGRLLQETQHAGLSASLGKQKQKHTPRA